ncbi:MAG: hypothetical protein AAB733_01905 [Patescibacteria group bacterium]
MLKRLEGHPEQTMHAWRFEGSEHLGKYTIAKSWSHQLLCLKLQSGGCGFCVSCRAFQNERHPDLMELTPPDQRQGYTVENIRKLRSWISHSPFSGTRKMILVDEAERMTLGAANAMLKFLEEPAPHSLVVLVSHDGGRLLGTIRSRCSLLRFSPLPQEQIRAFVQQGLLKISDARMIPACRGRMGLLNRWLDQPNEWDRHLTRLGILSEWTSLPLHLRLRQCDEIISKSPSFLDQQNIAKQWIEDVMTLIRDRLLLKGKSIFSVYPHFAASAPNSLSASGEQRILQSGFRSLRLLDQNTQPKMVLETFALQFNN